MQQAGEGKIGCLCTRPHLLDCQLAKEAKAKVVNILEEIEIGYVTIDMIVSCMIRQHLDDGWPGCGHRNYGPQDQIILTRLLRFHPRYYFSREKYYCKKCGNASPVRGWR
jgi:hypothetical protein